MLQYIQCRAYLSATQRGASLQSESASATEGDTVKHSKAGKLQGHLIPVVWLVALDPH